MDNERVLENDEVYVCALRLREKLDASKMIFKSDFLKNRQRLKNCQIFQTIFVVYLTLQIRRWKKYSTKGNLSKNRNVFAKMFMKQRFTPTEQGALYGLLRTHFFRVEQAGKEAVTSRHCHGGRVEKGARKIGFPRCWHLPTAPALWEASLGRQQGTALTAELSWTAPDRTVTVAPLSAQLVTSQTPRPLTWRGGSDLS